MTATAPDDLAPWRAWVTRNEATFRAHPRLALATVDQIAESLRRSSRVVPDCTYPPADAERVARALAKRERKNVRRLLDQCRHWTVLP